MIKEDYVSYETAKLLKEKGFDEDINLWYDENGKVFFQQKYDIRYNWRVRQGLKIYQCPTLQMTMKWLRENKGIAVVPILSSVLDNEKFLWDIEITVAKTNESYLQGWIYEHYEKACEAAIKYCLENLI